MELYKIGKVVSQKDRYVIFESNYVGETIFVSTFNTYEMNKVIKLFIYQYKNEYANDVYGFKTFNERYLFIDLISLPGVGPKTAMLILNNDFTKVAMWIAHGDVEQLTSLQHISTKVGRQLIFELQEKYSNFYNNDKKEIKDSDNVKKDNIKLKDLKVTLKTLGFQKTQISTAIDNLDNWTLPLEDLVEQSIHVIANAK